MTRHRPNRVVQNVYPAGSPQNGARPIVAIVGRPNVGKSTLFNRLAGRKLAIVHDEPGVTRDRHYADTSFGGRAFTLVDTGGFDPDSEDPVAQGIAKQIEIAISEADVILFVVDGSAGLTTADEQAVTLLRRTSKPVLYLANKADSARVDAEAADIYRLGVERVFPVSALHGRGMHEVEGALLQAMPNAPSVAELEYDEDEFLDDEDTDVDLAPASQSDDDAAEPSKASGGSDEQFDDDTEEYEPEFEEDATQDSAHDGRDTDPDLEAALEEEKKAELDAAYAKRPIRVALVGRPNAGKSSLLNRVAGEERVLVDSRPGTTVDAIDTVVTYSGKDYVMVDTAGIRRKAQVTKSASIVEAVSVLHAIRAIERSDVVVLVCDGSEGVAEQDAKVLGLAIERGRAVIVALNKSDICDSKQLKAAEEHAREKLAFASFAPIVTISAHSGRGVNTLMKTVDSVYEGFIKRVPTGQLNRFFENVLETHPPPTQSGKAPRLYYVTQARTRPPLFVVMSNNPDAIHFSYQRFVVNQLRKTFGFDGVPVRVAYRARRKKWWSEEERKGRG